MGALRRLVEKLRDFFASVLWLLAFSGADSWLIRLIERFVDGERKLTIWSRAPGVLSPWVPERTYSERYVRNVLRLLERGVLFNGREYRAFPLDKNPNVKGGK